MYKVIRLFADLQDKNHIYNVGDVFPRVGVNVSEERFAELASSNNKRGVPLIERVEVQDASETPKKTPARKAKKAPKE